MKKHIMTILIVILSFTTILFAVLWQVAAHDRSDIRLMAKAGAGEAAECFAEFQKSGDDADFIRGVSALRTFSTAYTLMTEGTVRYPDHMMIERLIGALISSPASAKEHISDLTEIMELLSKNPVDITALTRLSELQTALTH